MKSMLDKTLSTGHPFMTYLEFRSLRQFASFAVVTQEWVSSRCQRKVREENMEALALAWTHGWSSWLQGMELQGHWRSKQDGIIIGVLRCQPAWKANSCEQMLHKEHTEATERLLLSHSWEEPLILNWHSCTRGKFFCVMVPFLVLSWSSWLL